jgi:chromosomal replication initiation ATPase DnaA
MGESPGPRQLALALGHAESLSREDFLPGPCNAAALALVERWPDWPGRVAALIGPEGAGKSHLAAIWADLAGARFLAARALDTARLPAALSTGTLVLEDAEPGEIDERALFHLLNMVREQEGYLLITARTTPAAWRLRVNDLASRLRAVPAVELAPPDDALLRAVTVKLFADRQMVVDESLVTYLATRVERSFAAIRSVVAELDREALQLQRPVTRALAAEILGRREP